MAGTKDLVADDHVLMSFRWRVAGGEAVVKWVEGAPHAFLGFPRESVGVVGVGEGIVGEFIKERL